VRLPSLLLLLLPLSGRFQAGAAATSGCLWRWRGARRASATAGAVGPLCRRPCRRSLCTAHQRRRSSRGTSGPPARCLTTTRSTGSMGMGSGSSSSSSSIQAIRATVEAEAPTTTHPHGAPWRMAAGAAVLVGMAAHREHHRPTQPPLHLPLPPLQFQRRQQQAGPTRPLRRRPPLSSQTRTRTITVAGSAAVTAAGGRQGRQWEGEECQGRHPWAAAVVVSSLADPAAATTGERRRTTSWPPLTTASCAYFRWVDPCLDGRVGRAGCPGR
jgi:hypothetical protein